DTFQATTAPTACMDSFGGFLAAEGTMRYACLLLVAAAVAVAPAQPPPQPPAARAVPRAECLPADQLPPELRAKSEELLLQMLDREGLYTLVGGLKPITGPAYGLVGEQKTLPAEGAADSLVVKDAEEWRGLMSVWRCGDGLYADVLVLTDLRVGRRYFEGFVVHVPSLRRTVAAHREYFARLGITPTS